MTIEPIMENSGGILNPFAASAKSLARRLATIGENRLELFALEIQEESERVRHAFVLSLGVAAFGLLAGLTFTAAITVLLWAHSPAVVLLILTALYIAGGVCLYRRLNELLRNWQTLAASIDQIRKDSACLENIPG
jgi:uncharacterized membrane protein YqjE